VWRIFSMSGSRLVARGEYSHRLSLYLSHLEKILNV
jgi:hypothetical protein